MAKIDAKWLKLSDQFKRNSSVGGNYGNLQLSDNLKIANNLTVGGDLRVEGSEVILNTQTWQVEDKNIEIGNIKGPEWFGDLGTRTSDTEGVWEKDAGQSPDPFSFEEFDLVTLYWGDGRAVASINEGGVSNPSQTLTFTVISGPNLPPAGTPMSARKHIYNDTSAHGGGITLKGTTDKSIFWESASNSWTSTENFNLSSGKSFFINEANVLSSNTLGIDIVNSSLTKLGLSTAGFVKSDASGNLSVDTSTYLTSNQSISLSGDVTGSGTTSIATTIANAAVTNAKLANMVAYSVKVRAGNTTGVPGDLAVSAQSIIGRATGDIVNITAGNDSVLRRSGSGALSFGTLVTNNIGNSQVTFSKIQNSASAGLSVIGRSAASAGVFAEINAANDHQVLRRNGSSVGFGAIALNQASAVTGTLPVSNGGTDIGSYAQGDIIYASGTSTLAKLAKNATASRYLSNGGTNNNPSWSQINLANGVTGTLPVANGGTNTATTAANTFFAGPTSSTGAPSFRAIAKSDIESVISGESFVAGEHWTFEKGISVEGFDIDVTENLKIDRSILFTSVNWDWDGGTLFTFDNRRVHWVDSNTNDRPSSQANTLRFEDNSQNLIKIAGIWDGEPITMDQVSGVHTPIVDLFDLTSGQVSQKYVQLSEDPFDFQQVVMQVRGGPNLQYGEDFYVTGSGGNSLLVWDNSDLEDILETNDHLTIIYSY